MAATLKEVAQRAGVSTTLVSYIVNGRPVSIPKETRDTVLRAIEELQYVPSAVARGLRSRKTHSIAHLFLNYVAESTLSDPSTGSPQNPPTRSNQGLLTGGFGFMNYAGISANSVSSSLPTPRTGQIVARIDF